MLTHSRGQLPPEMWARIFVLVKPDSKELLVRPWKFTARSEAVLHIMADQACFRQLQLVCSTFNKVFAEHPELSDEMLLNEHAIRSSVPSALLWIQRWRHSICRLVAFTEHEHQTVVLEALNWVASLKCAIMSHASMSIVSMLPGFSSLSRCDFHSPEDVLELSALHSLYSLQQLYLSDANFCATPSHMLVLSAVDCQIYFNGDSTHSINMTSISLLLDSV